LNGFMLFDCLYFRHVQVPYLSYKDDLSTSKGNIAYTP
jgi:hypothetical protein